MNLEGIFAIVLSLLIPIVAIVMGVIFSIKKKNAEVELRRLIIENHTDMEIAKQLIEQHEPKTNEFVSLRWACVLIGMGCGALIDYLLGLNPYGNMKIYFWIIIAFGVGLGLMASFLVESKLQQNNTNEQEMS